MKNKNKITVILLVVVMLLLSTSAALARPTLAQFTLVNKSAHTVYFSMYEADVIRYSAQHIEYPATSGGAFYYVAVGAEQEVTITVDRALYFYTISNICGTKTLSGPIDVTNGNKIVLPKACLTYYPTYEEPLTLGGVMEENTLVAFSVENTTEEVLNVTMTGPQVISFQLPAGVSRSFTAEEGTYTYTYQCMGATRYSAETGSWLLAFHQTLKLGCD
ncbi:MAG: hypothetical protein H8D34_32795 [Chloroflexi bacterium]|nr:hypothetical protein [Chloroflexota bacterium]